MIDTLEKDVLEHPAIMAWRELSPERVEPDRISALQSMRYSAVYRLEGLGPGRSAVIAKRCKMNVANAERAVYRDILPHLPVTSLRFYGLVEAKIEPGDKPQCWLFLEDAGGETYSDKDLEQRVLAGRWLGTLHSSAARFEGVGALPGRGAAYYWEEVEYARTTIQQNLRNPSLREGDWETLQAILAQYNTVESHWSEIERSCESIPATLVHGDLARKNVRVRTGPEGKNLVVMDWEGAGWGVPAPDLAQFVGRSVSPDLRAYLEVVRIAWPWLDERALQGIAELGKLLRTILAISWASYSLRHKWLEGPMQEMRLYSAWITDSIQAAGWRTSL